MDRRTFLKTTTLAAGSGIALPSAPAQAGTNGDAVAAPAISRGSQELTFAAAWASEVPVLGDAAKRIGDRLGQVLEGKYRLVPAGAADVADLSFGPVSVDKEPVLAFFAGLPGSYGLEPAHLQAWLAVGGGQLLWDDVAARYGFKPLLAGHSGTRPGLWSNRPLRSAADLAGVAVILLGAGPAMAQRLGAEPARIPPSEWGSALASDRATAVEFGSPLAGLMLRLPQSATHFYRGGIHRNGTAFALNVRLPVWERMDTATRLALENLAAHELALSLSELLAHAVLAEQAIADTPDLEIAGLSASLATTVDQTAAAYIDQIAVSSPDAARIRDSYLTFRNLTSPHLTA